MSKLFFLFNLCVLFAGCNTSDKPEENNPEPVNTLPAPQPITFTIDGIYPHDTTAFTQGLQFYNGKLYEGTGQYEESSLYKR